MKWIMDLYREFTSFEGSLFKYSLSFSLLLALAPSLLLIAMLFRFAYLPMDIIMKSHESVEVPKWSIRIKSVVLFVSLVLLLVLSIFIATRLNEFLPIVSAVIMLLLFTMMYRALSFRKRNWSFGVIGAMFSTICILGLAALFVTIVSHFTSYKDVYGPLASLVTLLLAIYLISCIIYLGFCLNLICEEDYGREEALPLKNEKFFILCSELTKRIRSRF